MTTLTGFSKITQQGMDASAWATRLGKSKSEGHHQKSAADENKGNNPWGFHHSLKIAPLRLISSINPGIQLSYEYRGNSQFSTQFTATYLYSGLAPYFISGCYYVKGFRLNLEERYYLTKDPLLNLYVSLEGDYLKSKYSSKFTVKYDGSFYSVSSQKKLANINRQSICLNAKIGNQMIMGRFVVDVAIGLGLKYREAVFFNNEFRPDQYIIDDLGTYLHRPGKSFSLSVPTNFKIGWMF